MFGLGTKLPDVALGKPYTSQELAKRARLKKTTVIGLSTLGGIFLVAGAISWFGPKETSFGFSVLAYACLYVGVIWLLWFTFTQFSGAKRASTQEEYDASQKALADKKAAEAALKDADAGLLGKGGESGI